MTHPAYLESEGGYISNDAPIRIAQAALALGVRDYVVPGTKPSMIKEFAKSLQASGTFNFLMPGIGSQGGDLRDGFAAASPHHPFAIVGSAIYTAADPRMA